MNRTQINIILCALMLTLLPHDLLARKKCSPEEKLISVSSKIQPFWKDRLHFSDSGKEYFVGFSTQNDRLESGLTIATEYANSSLLDSVGQIVQKKSEGIITLDVDDIRQTFGSKSAIVYFNSRKRDEIYYEKWLSRRNCKDYYYYNVWVLVSVTNKEVEEETKKASIHLQKLQEEKSALNEDSFLTPDFADSFKSGLSFKKIDTEPVQNEIANSEDDGVFFHCGNIALLGGVSYPINPTTTNRGKFDSMGYNFAIEGEFPFTANFCGGVGTGYYTLRKSDGGTGSIVPFPLKMSARIPFGRKNGVVLWFGGEFGLAVLYGFNNKVEIEKYTNKEVEKKSASAGFWTAGNVGVDIRLQGRLYLSLSGSYVPLIGSKTFQFIMGRIGIRHYF